MQLKEVKIVFPFEEEKKNTYLFVKERTSCPGMFPDKIYLPKEWFKNKPPSSVTMSFKEEA